MKAYPIRNGEIFEPEVKEERTNKHRKEKEQECNCNRPYEIELTEQEWLQTASTEQLAWWLKKHMNCNFCPMRFKCEEMRDCKTNIKWWLQQPHEPFS